MLQETWVYTIQLVGENETKNALSSQKMKLTNKLLTIFTILFIFLVSAQFVQADLIGAHIAYEGQSE